MPKMKCGLYKTGSLGVSSNSYLIYERKRLVIDCINI